VPEPEPFHDLVVVLPGILGSTLEKNERLIWAPSAGAVIRAIRTFGRSITDLSLPDGIGDEHPDDGVVARGLMPDLHVLPGIWSANVGYDVLLAWLVARLGLTDTSSAGPDRPPNLIAVPYDWRLSNRFNGRMLKDRVEPALERWRSQGGPYAEAKLVFVCHSMGGLVASWYIRREGGAEVTRKLITLGTPFRGALNALDQLVNGIAKGIGPLRLDLTAFARTLPSTYQLLPEYACIESSGGLLKTVETDVPELDTGMVADAMRFHDQLNEAIPDRDASYDLHPIVGIRQRTATTARIAGRRVEVDDTIEDRDEGGDATVPRLSAAPPSVHPTSPTLRSIADKHGHLQSNSAVLDELDGVLTANPRRHRAGAIELGAEMDELILAGEPLEIRARERIALEASVIDERGNRRVVPLQRSRGVSRAIVPGLEPGGYLVIVGGVGPMASSVDPVTTPVLVWEASLT
jgi:hypothetical protein